ncbi:MAG TPA: triphosphoribosyl-dephospho-CoA synthase, partial [Tissierellaceae bacterium]
EDSNILGRHDIEALKYVKNKSKIAIDIGGIYTKEGKEYIEKLDKEFIRLNISSGGAADLLAVTLFIFLVEEGELDE